MKTKIILTLLLLVAFIGFNSCKKAIDVENNVNKEQSTKQGKDSSSSKSENTNGKEKEKPKLSSACDILSFKVHHGYGGGWPGNYMPGFHYVVEYVISEDTISYHYDYDDGLVYWPAEIEVIISDKATIWPSVYNFIGFDFSTNNQHFTVTAEDGRTRKTYTVKTTFSTTHKGHEFVDVGGVLWATCNIGANTPEEYGDYYAWGETETKSVYSKETYVSKPSTSLTALTSESDVANKKWGGFWRIPSERELSSLLSGCDWTWTGNGYIVKDHVNGNTIFLPAAGYRKGDSLYDNGKGAFYWASDYLYTYRYALKYSTIFHEVGRSSDYFSGFTVRPVCPWLHQRIR